MKKIYVLTNDENEEYMEAYTTYEKAIQGFMEIVRDLYCEEWWEEFGNEEYESIQDMLKGIEKEMREDNYYFNYNILKINLY